MTDSIFQKRPFEGSYSESGGIIQWKSSPSLLVLDGQQRLTSLYQALFCKAGVVRGERIYHFYVDVQALMSDEDGIEVGTPCFKDALFFVEERKGQRLRYQRLQLLYEITTREQELAHGVLPLSLTFAPDELNGWKGDYLASLVPNNDLKQYRDLDAKWNALVGSWLNRIRHYELPEVELNKQMTLEAICYIFEKVNSAGVPLNVFDLCNAILWAQNFQLNKEWEKKVKRTGAACADAAAGWSPLPDGHQPTGEPLAQAHSHRWRTNRSLMYSRRTTEAHWPCSEEMVGQIGVSVHRSREIHDGTGHHFQRSASVRSDHSSIGCCVFRNP